MMRTVRTTNFFLLIMSALLVLWGSDPAISETSDISILLRNGAIVSMAEKPPVISEADSDLSVKDRFVRLTSLNIGGLTYIYKNKIYKLDWNQILHTIETIELGEPDLSPYKNGRMIITKVSGETLKTNNGTILQYIGYEDAVKNINVIEYDSYHKFWRDKYLDIREIKKIRFRKTKKANTASANDLNFASSSDEIIASLSHTRYNEKKETGVNLNIEFDFDSHRIRRASYPLLNELGRALLDTKIRNKNITIKGHADSDGPMAYNQTLSLKRARSVRTYLVSKFGISPSRLTTAGYGETSPLVPNTSRANKQINRRVEIRASL